MTKLIINLFSKRNDKTGQNNRSAIGAGAGITGMICNCILFFGKIIIGIITGSISIIADALNNLSDLCSTLVTFFSFKLSNKPPDKEHPFGHGRAEYMAGFLVSVLVIVMGIELAKGSVEKIINPQPITFYWVTVGILIASVLIKLWMFFFYRKVSIVINSSAVKASSVDSISDCFSTLAVLIGVLVFYFFDVNVDAYIGLLVSAIIIISGIGLIKDTISPLLGQYPSDEVVEGIKSAVLSVDGVIGMHDLIVHDYGPGRIFASLHAEVDPDTDIITGHDIADECEKTVSEKMNIEIVVHIDPVERS